MFSTLSSSDLFRLLCNSSALYVCHTRMRMRSIVSSIDFRNGSSKCYFDSSQKRMNWKLKWSIFKHAFLTIHCFFRFNSIFRHSRCPHIIYSFYSFHSLTFLTQMLPFVFKYTHSKSTFNSPFLLHFSSPLSIHILIHIPYLFIKSRLKI